jgi:hypothetical protein
MEATCFRLWAIHRARVTLDYGNVLQECGNVLQECGSLQYGMECLLIRCTSARHATRADKRGFCCLLHFCCRRYSDTGHCDAARLRVAEWLAASSSRPSAVPFWLVVGDVVFMLYGTHCDILQERRHSKIVGVIEVTMRELEAMEDAEGDDPGTDVVEGSCGMHAGGKGVTLEQIQCSLRLQVRWLRALPCGGSCVCARALHASLWSPVALCAACRPASPRPLATCSRTKTWTNVPTLCTAA